MVMLGKGIMSINYTSTLVYLNQKESFLITDTSEQKSKWTIFLVGVGKKCLVGEIGSFSFWEEQKKGVKQKTEASEPVVDNTIHIKGGTLNRCVSSC